ncbi:MAG: FHA domain-containing protein [Kangiellaceae bacterium]|nr:FHA domain-containing protein [Kangiellaceae bacterium]MCW9017049.1 FHA domain-containing protein [Kangiellaceae bacterium]
MPPHQSFKADILHSNNLSNGTNSVLTIEQTTKLLKERQQLTLLEKTRLMFLKENQLSQVFIIEQPEVIIGRTDSADIFIEDNSISRQHAKIKLNREGYFIEDLGSTNGTYVQDQPIQDKFPLLDGSSILVGNILLQFFVARSCALSLWPTLNQWRQQDQAFMENLLDMLEKHIHKPNFSIEQVASDLYMSSRQLQRRVKEICGDTPNSLVTRVKMNRAKIMLECGAHIEKIAEDCGFSCSKSLSRAFKKNFDCTPGKYLESSNLLR